MRRSKSNATTALLYGTHKRSDKSKSARRENHSNERATPKSRAEELYRKAALSGTNFTTASKVHYTEKPLGKLSRAFRCANSHRLRIERHRRYEAPRTRREEHQLDRCAAQQSNASNSVRLAPLAAPCLAKLQIAGRLLARASRGSPQEAQSLQLAYNSRLTEQRHQGHTAFLAVFLRTSLPADAFESLQSGCSLGPQAELLRYLRAQPLVIQHRHRACTPRAGPRRRSNPHR